MSFGPCSKNLAENRFWSLSAWGAGAAFSIDCARGLPSPTGCCLARQARTALVEKATQGVCDMRGSRRLGRSTLAVTHGAGSSMFDRSRREFIVLTAGAAVAWPLAARAQQPERMRRIGLLMASADDREGQARVTPLKEGLQELGWTDGRNI